MPVHNSAHSKIVHGLHEILLTGFETPKFARVPTFTVELFDKANSYRKQFETAKPFRHVLIPRLQMPAEDVREAIPQSAQLLVAELSALLTTLKKVRWRIETVSAIKANCHGTGVREHSPDHRG